MARLTDQAPLRILKITEILFRAVLDGMSNKELATATGYSPSNISRDMRLLCEAGWARQLDNGRWAVSEKPVALMKMYQLYMNDLAERGRNFDLRVTAQARQML
ncbi:winged helix-turn-helix transcriptional regulator [uncultured Desulfovibrio sp.]|uniref:winged helix-turn-helix transcriptional regulator n=1 Tax=uncultured Desulfovibrio sp. TaxID=167968 RepID=UPI002588138A|nr:winged helix-turn-helix transcriptional regulator [uncultured Desulfovibrio sp.]